MSASVVKDSLKRLFTLRMKLGEFDDPKDQPYMDLSKYGHAQRQHPEVALDAARQAMVLLKNSAVAPDGSDGSVGKGEVPSLSSASTSGSALPLAGGGKLKLAVIGPHAGDNHLLKGNYAGNSYPTDNLVQALGHQAASVEYVRGAKNATMNWKALCEDSAAGSAAAAAASAAVAKADVVVMTIGTDGSHLSGNPYDSAAHPNHPFTQSRIHAVTHNMPYLSFSLGARVRLSKRVLSANCAHSSNVRWHHCAVRRMWSPGAAGVCFAAILRLAIPRSSAGQATAWRTKAAIAHQLRCRRSSAPSFVWCLRPPSQRRHP